MAEWRNSGGGIIATGWCDNTMSDWAEWKMQGQATTSTLRVGMLANYSRGAISARSMPSVPAGVFGCPEVGFTGGHSPMAGVSGKVAGISRWNHCVNQWLAWIASGERPMQ